MRWPWQKRHDEVPEVIGREEVKHSRAVAERQKADTRRVLVRRAHIIKQNNFTEDYGDAFYGPLRRPQEGH